MALKRRMAATILVNGRIEMTFCSMLGAEIRRPAGISFSQNTWPFRKKTFHTQKTESATHTTIENHTAL